MINQNPRPVNYKKVSKTVLIVGIVLLLLIVFVSFAPYIVVPAGHTGVMVTMGRVSDTVLQEGLQFKLPWQNVILIDNRTQKVEVVTQAFTSDIQQVDVICSINYRIETEMSQHLYKNVGTSFYSTVMLPRVMENLKGIFSKYTADNLLSERQTLAQQVSKALGPELQPYGIQVVSVAIEDIDFTDSFTEAVEAKQVAEQTMRKTLIQQEELLSVELSTAERVKINADASAEVTKINADAKAYSIRAQAEAESEANKMLAESITEPLIRYIEANGWDGKLPQFVSGDAGGVLPILDVTPAAE